VELRYLTGKHKLDGIDFYSEEMGSYGLYAVDDEFCRFRLDGTVYSAFEIPDSGNRNCLHELRIMKEGKINHEFPAIEVVGKQKNNNDKDDVLELINTHTGEIILELGTKYINNQYPYVVSLFYPENVITDSQNDN